MDLVHNSSCGLCEENTSVLGKKAVQPYITKVGKIFFNADKNNFKQFQDELISRTICSLCAQKISACTRFKNSYEEVQKPNGFTKTRSCFVCEKKGLHLIKTFDDPNGIIAKFTLFTNYTSNNASYEDCAMCLDCLFYINLWCEVHNTLVKKLNIDKPTLKSFQHTNHTAHLSDNGILKKDKENVTPPHNNIQPSYKKLRTANIEKNSTTSPKANKRMFRQSRENKTMVDRLPREFSIFLNKKLKNIKCLRDEGSDDLNLPETVLSDRKMFHEIPYVLISQDMENELNSPKKIKRSSRLNKPIEIVNVSDSEEEPVKRTLRVSFQLPPKQISTLEESKITCGICDEEFSTPCDYKSHCLWHEKPEYCQIKLVRRKLPVYAKVSEFNVDRKSIDEAQESDTNAVNHLILKYVCNTTSENIDEINSKSEETADLASLNDSEIGLINNSSNLEDKLDSCDSENESSDILTNENETPALAVDTSICDKTEEQTITISEGKEGEKFEQQEVADNDFEHSETNKSDEDFSESDEKCESDIEKALAQLHEEDLNNKNEDSDDQEDLVDKCSSGQEEDLGENLDYDDEAANNVRKRKRSSSSVSDGNSDDDNTPNLKKVRFAIDYSYTKCSDETTENQVEQINLSNSEEHVPTNVDDGCNN